MHLHVKHPSALIFSTIMASSLHLHVRTSHSTPAFVVRADAVVVAVDVVVVVVVAVVVGLRQVHTLGHISASTACQAAITLLLAAHIAAQDAWSSACVGQVQLQAFPQTAAVPPCMGAATMWRYKRPYQE